jgi:two-component system, response regulator RegA
MRASAHPRQGLLASKEMVERRFRTVLLVDDDESLLRAWRRAIDRENHSLTTASDPASARDFAKSEQPELVIVDMKLGSESGLELVRDLRTTLPASTIVVCSGFLSVASTVAAVRAGADHIVVKPITFSEILQRIDSDGEAPQPELETPTLARAEWEHIMRVLEDCDGNVTTAARKLGIHRTSLQRKLRKPLDG